MHFFIFPGKAPCLRLSARSSMLPDVFLTNIHSRGREFVLNRLEKEEEEDHVPGPGWGLQPLIVSPPLSVINASSFFVHFSSSAVRKGARKPLRY